MGLAPDAREYLETTKANERPPRKTLTPEENRAGHARAIAYMGEPEPLPVVRDLTVPGPAGDVPVRHRRFAGMFHPFWPLAGVLPAAREAQRYAADGLRAAFGGPAAGEG